jgi:hypothetical protein
LLAKKTCKKIIIITNEIENDPDIKRIDTRSSIIKITNLQKCNHIKVDNSFFRNITGEHYPDGFVYSDSEESTQYILTKFFTEVTSIFLDELDWNWYITNLSNNVQTKCFTIKDTNSYYIALDNSSDLPENYVFDLSNIDNLDFYVKQLPIIKDYLNFNNIIYPDLDETNPFVTPEDIVISVRVGGGITEHNSFAFSDSPGSLRIPFEYYQKAIPLFGKYNRLLICSDNYESDYLKQFNYPNIIFLTNFDTLQQFKLILDSKRVIASNSSFSIMASIISDSITTFPVINNHTVREDHTYGLLDGNNVNIYPHKPTHIYVHCNS